MADKKTEPESMDDPRRILHTFSYTFTVDEGQDPAKTLNQELYEIVVKGDGDVASFGQIEEITG